MKKCRLGYDEWKCIVSKEWYINRMDSELFKGYVGLLDIHKVTEPQIWGIQGEKVAVCDNGYKWLTILPRDDWYCITVMMNAEQEFLVAYIDIIAGQGIDEDNVPYFDDIYLDLVVYRDGTIKVDNMDELEDALACGDITQEQFELALKTSERLKSGLLGDFVAFQEFVNRLWERVVWENKEIL